jgi:hypothetical protein
MHTYTYINIHTYIYTQTSGLDATADHLRNSECVGGEQLLQLLKNYSRNK